MALVTTVNSRDGSLALGDPLHLPRPHRRDTGQHDFAVAAPRGVRGLLDIEVATLASRGSDDSDLVRPRVIVAAASVVDPLHHS